MMGKRLPISEIEFNDALTELLLTGGKTYNQLSQEGS
jgi:hypothetical protein